MDLVSVYITTCNRLEKLERAIKSVQNQTYSNVEIIVCDDASSDGTELYMNNISENNSNIIYIRSPIRKGACYNRNQAISMAKGRFITGLDDDDEFEKNRIEFFVKNWNEKYSFICADFYDCYKNGTTTRHYDRGFEGDYKNLLIKNEASNQIFTLKERLESIGGFDEDVKRLQDWDTWLRLSYKFGSFKRYNRALYLMHHDHEANEQRVSKSYSLKNALQDFINRNKELYDTKSLKVMEFNISFESGRNSFVKSIVASIYSLNPRYILKSLIGKRKE